MLKGKVMLIWIFNEPCVVPNPHCKFFFLLYKTEITDYILQENTISVFLLFV